MPQHRAGAHLARGEASGKLCCVRRLQIFAISKRCAAAGSPAASVVTPTRACATLKVYKACWEPQVRLVRSFGGALLLPLATPGYPWLPPMAPSRPRGFSGGARVHARPSRCTKSAGSLRCAAGAVWGRALWTPLATPGYPWQLASPLGAMSAPRGASCVHRGYM